MAVVAWTVVEPPSPNVNITGLRIIKWPNLLSADSGSPYFAPQYSAKVIQLSGTAGVGGAGTIQGTLEPGTPIYGTLHSPDSVAWTFVAADVTNNVIKQVLEDCYQIRPLMTGGDGSTSVTIYLFINTSARR